MIDLLIDFKQQQKRPVTKRFKYRCSSIFIFVRNHLQNTLVRLSILKSEFRKKNPKFRIKINFPTLNDLQLNTNLVIRFVKESYARKITFAKWQVNFLAVTLISIGIGIGLLITAGNFLKDVLAAGELTTTWNFASAGDYTVSDSNLAEVASSTGKLKVRNYSNDGSTNALFHLDEASGGTADDSSSNNNDLTVTSASFTSGNLNNALSFDGASSRAEAADAASLSITGANTLEAWVKLNSTFNATSHNHDLGIIDKGSYKLYFNHNTGKITYELADSTSTSWTQQAGNETNQGWDLNGKLSTESSTVMSSNLYVGTGNAVSDAEVWRWNGTTWTMLGGDGINSSWASQLYEQVLSLTNDGTNVYAGLGNTAGDAEVWRYNGSTWSKIGGDGVNSSWSAAGGWEGVYSLDYYGGNLYAGLGNSANDAEVWRYNGSTWSKIGGDSLNSGWTTNFELVWSMTNDGTNLYAGLGTSAQDAEVWRWNGSAWTRIGGDGVNSSWSAASNIETVRSMEYYGGNLYAGVGDTAGDADVWRWNGSSWTQIGGDALNSGWAASTYEGVYSMANDGTNLYIGLGTTAGDNEVYRWNGSAWTKIGGDGVNSGFTTTHTIVQILEYYSSTLYAGITTTNATSEVWSFNGSSWTRIAGNYINSSWGFYNLGSAESAAVVGDYLYFGTGLATAGNALVFRFDGSTWTIIGGQGVNSSWTINTYEVVNSLINFDGELYAALGSSANDAEVWKYNGSAWSQVGGDSLNSGWTTNYESVLSFAADETYLYAGLGTSTGDAEVWRWNGSVWGKIGGDGTGSSWNTNYESVMSMGIYGGQLYAGLGTGAGDAEVWRYNGSTWSQIGGDGLNSSWATSTYETVEAMASANNRLYVGLGNSSDDAELWEYNGSSWTRIGGDDVNSSWASGEMERIRSVRAFNGDLFASTGSAAGDAEVWKYNGSTWSKIGGDDLNNSWASGTAEHATTMITYKGKLYVGIGDTGNADAAVWSYGNNAYLESSTSSFNTDWRHIAATYDGSSLKIYINGVEDNSLSASRTLPDNTYPLLIGARFASGDNGLQQGIMNGLIDEVRISNTARVSFTTSPYSSDAQTVRPASAVYTSGVLQWDSFSTSETANGGTITYRVSNDGGTTWKYWTGAAWGTSSSTSEANSAATINSNITTLPVTTGGFMWQAILDGDGTQLVTLNSVTLVASEDATVPNPPDSITALNASGGGTNLTTNTWYNYSAPYFSWTGATDPGGSGIEGYWVYFGTDNTAVPSTAGSFQVASNYTAGSLSSNSTYYLRIQARDNAQNLSSTYAAFIYKYDGTVPNNPSSLTVLPPGYTASNSYTFIWASDATDPSGSGLTGYQYSINSTSDWSSTIGSGTYQVELDDVADEGANTFYLRTLDTAGNATSTYKQVNFYYAGTAPSPPQDLDVNPDTNTTNSFAFSWSHPASYTGMPDSSGLTYCYTINVVPSSTTCTFTSAGATSLAASSFANQPGINTFYLVAKDSVDNINYDAYASITFTANTSSPGIPLNVEIADVSVKDTESWKLALSWEAPSTGSTGITYEIYHSTDDSTYTFDAEVSGIAHIDTGLTQTTHYYKVRACDSTNNCGAFTAAVSAYPDGRYTEAPTLTSDPTVTGITTKKATISWATDRTSDTKIQYGTSEGDYFDEEPSNSDQVTDHTLTLSNLSPGTRYYYLAKWTDEDGNTGLSDELTFTTEPAPSITDPKAVSVNLSTATIRYTAKGASKVRIYYGETQSFGATVEVSTSTTETTYNTILEELKDGTKYFFKINTFDAENAEYEGNALSFETLPRPKISEVRIQQVRGTAQPTVLVTWKTNTETSSIVTYYPTTDPSQTRDEVNVDFVKDEHRILIRGLQPETPYTMIVKGRDRNGNEAASDPQRFTTATDTRAPVISDLAVEGTDIPNPNGGTEASTSQLVISWTTDEPSTSQIEYGEGTGTSYPQRTQEDKSMVTNHTVVISGLVPSRVYHFRVVSRDKANNAGYSVDTVTITPKASDNALDLVINNLSQVFGFLKN